MPSQIDIYREMTALSSEMVAAARSQDWERLVTLEQSVAALRDTLMSGSDIQLTVDESRLKGALIERILDDDAEIRRHTEPWMEHVRVFLGDGVRKRQVEQAYGAHSL